MLRKRLALAALAVLVLVVSRAPAGDVVLYDPTNPVIKASAIDQPVLCAVLANTSDANTIIGGTGNPVIFRAFVDTGASSSMISFLQATGAQGADSLGITSADYEGNYAETGIGGQEAGKVSRLYNVLVLNGNSTSGDVTVLNQFVDYGAHKLWVRQAEGVGETLSFMGFDLVDPINIVGMPIIRQRVMEMDFTPIANLETMATRLLPSGSSELHATNVTLDLCLRSFVGPAPPGETLPTWSENPVVCSISVSVDPGGGTRSISDNEWLFDTGAGSTFISFQRAQELGLIPASDGNLAEFMSTYGGIRLPVGGVGAGVDVPVLRVDEIRIPAKEGFDLVWKNVDVMVLDIPSDPSDPNSATLDGVFGMNLLVPSVTIDVASIDPTKINPDDALAILLGLLDFSPGYFEYAAFDATDPGHVELRLYTTLAPVPEPATLALLALGGLALLRRRRRRRVRA